MFRNDPTLRLFLPAKQYRPVAIEYQRIWPLQAGLVIVYQRKHDQIGGMMKKLVKSVALAAMLGTTAIAAEAACYADYKAKRDNPLKLHYGVVELPDSACGSLQAATANIAPRLAANGWVLLNVLSIFNADGLAQRKESAGEYYLRY